jgi:hypothetical protein
MLNDGKLSLAIQVFLRRIQQKVHVQFKSIGYGSNGLFEADSFTQVAEGVSTQSD